MKSVKIKLIGRAPYLQNKLTAEQLMKETNPTKAKTKAGKKIYKPEEEAEKGVYKNKNNKFYIPSIHIEKSMEAAGSAFPDGGRKNYKKRVKAACFVDPKEILIEPQNYEIDETVGRRPPRTGGKVVIWRPRFDNWKSEPFEINIIDDNFDPETAIAILRHAGQQIGIGDDRPRYGRFDVEVVGEG